MNKKIRRMRPSDVSCIIAALLAFAAIAAVIWFGQGRLQ